MIRTPFKVFKRKVARALDKRIWVIRMYEYGIFCWTISYYCLLSVLIFTTKEPTILWLYVTSGSIEQPQVYTTYSYNNICNCSDSNRLYNN